MFDPKVFDDITKKLSDALPPGLGNMKKDLERTFHGILQGAFSKLDLVTREEFDTQVAVLAKTREKLEKLEQQIAEMESFTATSAKKPKKTDNKKG